MKYFETLLFQSAATICAQVIGQIYRKERSILLIERTYEHRCSIFWVESALKINKFDLQELIPQRCAFSESFNENFEYSFFPKNTSMSSHRAIGLNDARVLYYLFKIGLFLNFQI